MHDRAHTDKRAGIIGGKGAFGQWCVRFFERYGHQVMISDLDTECCVRDLMHACSVVVLAVPIGETERVLRDVAGELRSDQLLIELSSVKSPFAELLCGLSSEVLSLHPMFSPRLSDHQGQSCIVWRVRRGELSDYIEGLLVREGLRLVEMDSDRHDRMMAVVQGLTHFQAIAAAHCMRALGFDPEESLMCASPVYRVRLEMIGRIIAQNPRLYAEIQMYNPYVTEVIAELERSSNLLGSLVKARDVEGFVSEFGAVQRDLGAFALNALEQSDRMISGQSKLIKG